MSTPLHDLVAAARLESETITAPLREQNSPQPEILRGPALRRRRSRIEMTRTVVQMFSLAVILWIGAQFIFWVHALEAGRIAGVRPPGVEGFLPISALLSLRHLFSTGEWSRVHPAGLVILGLALANGLLLKRSFCSWICPVGTISESLAAVSRTLFRRRLRLPRALDYPLRSLKYLLLGYFLYAIFLQMTPHDIRYFIDSPYNKVADIKMLHFFLQLSPFAAKVLLVLLGLSFVVPYFWCRYLCPYGGFLAGLSLLSPLKIRRDPSSCIDCGLCNKACPVNLKVDVSRTIRSDECFGCLSCVAACPVPALEMKSPGRRGRAVRPLVYAALVAGLFFGGIQAAKLAGYWNTEISEAEYLRRVQEIDHPKYHHARGQVPEYGPLD